MDYETLFYLAIAAIYILYQVLAGNKKKKTRRPGTPLPPAPDAIDSAGPTAAEPTLDDALREIRQALGMEVPEAPPKPPPRPVEAPAPRPAAPPSEFKPVSTRFADAEFEAKPTAFGPAASLHKREPAPPARTAPARRTPAPGKVLKAKPTAPPESALPADLTRRLRDPQAAREAFVLGEVLGPPRAHRRR